MGKIVEFIKVIFKLENLCKFALVLTIIHLILLFFVPLKVNVGTRRGYRSWESGVLGRIDASVGGSVLIE